MRFLSVCSGIGCADLAFSRLGWEPAGLAEIAPFPRAVLAHRFPGVPLHGDFTAIEAGGHGPVDLIVGGTPCQSFSIAGLRGGLADERGNLALEYLRLVGRVRPTWCVWENVPGVLSSNGGRDFGAFLGGLVELGYGLAWRVLDAQHFGLAQRRERVFVVGCAGDWRRAAAVLFEPASLRGHPAPRREAGQRVAGTLEASLGRRCGQPNDHDPAGGLTIARCLTGHPSRSDGETETFVAIRTANTGSNGHGFGEVAYTLDRGAGAGQAVAFDITGVPATVGGRETDLHTALRARAPGGSEASTTTVVAFMENQRGELRVSAQTDALTTGGGKPGQGYAAAATSMGVRRLTPRECERLQGLPDDWTLVPYRGKPAADGPRYKAIGNGMAVPCLEWIGRRIERGVPANETWPEGRGFLRREAGAPARHQTDLFASAAE